MEVSEWEEGGNLLPEATTSVGLTDRAGPDASLAAMLENVGSDGWRGFENGVGQGVCGGWPKWAPHLEGFHTGAAQGEPTADPLLFS